MGFIRNNTGSIISEYFKAGVDMGKIPKGQAVDISLFQNNLTLKYNILKDPIVIPYSEITYVQFVKDLIFVHGGKTYIFKDTRNFKGKKLVAKLIELVEAAKPKPVKTPPPVTETVRVIDVDGKVKNVPKYMKILDDDFVLFTDGGKTYHKHVGCYEKWLPEYKKNFKEWKVISKKEAEDLGLYYCRFCKELDELDDWHDDFFKDDYDEYDDDWDDEVNKYE